MGKYTVAQLKQWHASTSFDKDTIQNSKLLGCFNCLKIYTPSSIKAYLDSDQWGGQGHLFCPHCYIDSVISDGGTGEIDPQLLKEMRQRYFLDDMDKDDQINLAWEKRYEQG